MSTNPPTEQPLLDKLQRSDVPSVQRRAAWQAFVGRYIGVLDRWARCWGFPEDEAQRYAVGVLAELRTSIRTYRRVDGSLFRSWLKTVTDNYIRRHRRRGPEPILVGSGAGQLRDPTPQEITQMTDELDRGEWDRAGRLQDALAEVEAALGADKVKVFVRRHSCHPRPTYRELAAEFNVAQGTLRQWVYRVTAQLRRRLPDLEMPPGEAPQ